MTQTGEPVNELKTSLKAMQIICATLMIGITFFAAIGVVLIMVNGPVLDEEGLKFKDIFLYISIGLALGGILLARYLYNKKVTVVRDLQTSLNNKLIQYRISLISFMAPCEGAALFSIIVLIFTGNFWILSITVVMLVLMFSKFPFSGKLISELNLDWKEQQELI